MMASTLQNGGLFSNGEESNKRTSSSKEMEQTGPVIAGPGAMRSPAALLGLGLVKLTSEQQAMVTKAKKYAMEQSVKEVLKKQHRAHQQQQQKTLQRNQALVLMCRLFVGSISFDLKEDALKQAFSPFGPVKSINLNWDPLTRKHKGFAFVEYDLPEAAQLAIEQMNNVMLGGRSIKVVGRPSNMPHAQPIVEEIMEEAKNFNRIYIASVHPDLTESDVQSVFEAFGKIKSCELVSSGIRGKHRGYGFIEYETHKAAQDAVNSMNLFDLGGQYLRVGRAITPPNAFFKPSGSSSMPTAAAVAAAAATAKIQAINAVVSNVQVLGLGKAANSPPTVPTSPGIIPPTLAPVIQPPGVVSVLPRPSIVPPPQVVTVIPPNIAGTQAATVTNLSPIHPVPVIIPKIESNVVILRNMVGPEDLDSELEEEVTEECGRFGSVERVIIYQEKQSEHTTTDIVVKIFVQFGDNASAKRARDALNGRYFGGRAIKAELYDQKMYQDNDLSG